MATSRLVLEQTTAHRNLAKPTHKINHQPPSNILFLSRLSPRCPSQAHVYLLHSDFILIIPSIKIQTLMNEQSQIHMSINFLQITVPSMERKT